MFNLFYYFRNYDFRILNINLLIKSTEKRDLIFFDKLYHPFKNKLNNINDINKSFCYLSKDKQIYYVSKDNYNFIDNSLNIKNSNDIIEIFDNTEQYNYIDHEEMIETKDYDIVDFHYLCKLISNNNIKSILNKNTSIKIIEDYLKYKYPNKHIYHHIIIITNNNLNELLSTNFYDIQSFYSLFINIKSYDIETEYKLNCLLLLFKKLTFQIYHYNNISTISDILFDKLLYFENLVFYKKKVNIDIDKFDYYLKYYKGVITDDIIIIPAFNFCKINFINEVYNFYDVISSSLLNDSELNIYSHNKKSTLQIYENYNHIEKILFNIKDYNTLFTKIDNALKKCYSVKQTGILLVKKITIAILTNKEKILNDQLMNILNNFNEISQLQNIEVLISKTKFNKIKKNIYIKLLEKDDDINMCSKYLLLLFKLELEESDIKIVIKKLKNNKEIFNRIDKNILLLFLLKNTINKIDIIDIFSDFVKENYDIKDINSIEGLLKLGQKIKVNKHIILLLLLNISTKFDCYYKTYQDFIDAREKIKNNLLYIESKIDEIDSKISLENITIFNVGNFELSYQGIPSPEIFNLKSRIFRKICTDLNYKIDTNFKNEKIKILFHASQINRVHSVYKDRHQVIKYLSNQPEFEVYFSTFDELNQEVKFTFGNAKHIILPRKLLKIKEILTKMKLDFIVYCEIGMDNTSYFMAHMKMAKYQCNTWGHSDTSGIDTIDYFFSSKLYELDYNESQKHYTEKLILQNSLCTSYVNPLSKYKIETFKNRYHFGFTDETIIYFCAQSLFKFNPIYDEYLIEILTNVPNSILIMLNNDNKYKFIERFNNKKIVDRIHFFPPQIHKDFMNLMYISDVILDIYPFGGCNSSMEGFSLNKVIVTQPSNMINGRFTHGFYIKMGLDDFISKNKKEYIKFAIKLGLDYEYRKEKENKIKKNKDKLFLDEQTLNEWKNDLIKIYTS